MRIANSYGQKLSRAKAPMFLSNLLMGFPDQAGHKLVAEILNNRPEYLSLEHHKRLLKLVDLWELSGRNWQNRKFWKENQVDLNALFQELNSAVRVWIVPSPFRDRHHGRLFLNADSTSYGSTPETGLGWLVMLWTHENQELWGGRCQRCQKFYVKNSQRQKVYCSQRCGSADTGSGEKKRQQRAETRARRIEQANRLVSEWESMRKSSQWNYTGNWKAFIADKMQGEGVTASWVTRYVNKGEIRRPAA